MTECCIHTPKSSACLVLHRLVIFLSPLCTQKFMRAIKGCNTLWFSGGKMCEQNFSSIFLDVSAPFFTFFFFLQVNAGNVLTTHCLNGLRFFFSPSINDTKCLPKSPPFLVAISKMIAVFIGLFFVCENWNSTMSRLLQASDRCELREPCNMTVLKHAWLKQSECWKKNRLVSFWCACFCMSCSIKCLEHICTQEEKKNAFHEAFIYLGETWWFIARIPWVLC